MISIFTLGMRLLLIVLPCIVVGTPIEDSLLDLSSFNRNVTVDPNESCFQANNTVIDLFIPTCYEWQRQAFTDFYLCNEIECVPPWVCECSAT